MRRKAPWQSLGDSRDYGIAALRSQRHISVFRTFYETVNDVAEFIAFEDFRQKDLHPGTLFLNHLPETFRIKPAHRRKPPSGRHEGRPEGFAQRPVKAFPVNGDDQPGPDVLQKGSALSVAQVRPQKKHVAAHRRFKSSTRIGQEPETARFDSKGEFTIHTEIPGMKRRVFFRGHVIGRKPRQEDMPGLESLYLKGSEVKPVPTPDFPDMIARNSASG